MNAPEIPSPELTEENLKQLQEARVRLRHISRAVAIAKMDGWTIGIFGGLTLFGGVVSWDIIGIIFGAGLCFMSYFELKGAKRLKKLDPDAVKLLGVNQISLGSLLVMYGAWMMMLTLTGHSELGGLLGTSPEASKFVKVIGIGVYGTVMGIGISVQGSMALYYFSRRKFIEAYVKQTPFWIVNMQKVGLSI
jgi:hypothetical protein